MSFKAKDHYFFKAKKDGYVARSAYKLLDLQKRHKLILRGQSVLDLGCSPGSWSQVALELVGTDGRLVGVDLKPVTINAPAHAKFIVGDILKLSVDELAGPFDVVLSDMAPNTTGIRIRDQAHSEELCRMVLNIAKSHLKPGGHLVMKLFEGPEAQEIVKEAKSMFARVDRTKPEAVRKGSFETYIVGLKRNK